MSAPLKFVRMIIAGTPVHCSDLELDPVGDDMFRLTIRGTGFPERLRQSVGMGSGIEIISRSATHENTDVFVAQDAPGGNVEPDGTFMMTLEAVLIRRPPRLLDQSELAQECEDGEGSPPG